MKLTKIFYSVNALDIAPDYGSVILGISNSVSCLTGIISPILTGYLVQNQVKYCFIMTTNHDNNLLKLFRPLTNGVLYFILQALYIYLAALYIGFGAQVNNNHGLW